MGDVRDVYAPLAQSLNEAGFRVVTADLRGHGDSSATFTAYGDEATAADLIALIEVLDAGPVILVGASMSGLLRSSPPGVALTWCAGSSSSAPSCVGRRAEPRHSCSAPCLGLR